MHISEIFLYKRKSILVCYVCRNMIRESLFSIIKLLRLALTNCEYKNGTCCFHKNVDLPNMRQTLEKKKAFEVLDFRTCCDRRQHRPINDEWTFP